MTYNFCVTVRLNISTYVWIYTFEWSPEFWLTYLFDWVDVLDFFICGSS